MEQANYAARMRYLSASQVDDPAVNYDGLDVVGPDEKKLGDLDGFVVDADAGRVYYVVIDTAGWFRTKQLLLPIGHARLDSDRRLLRVDVMRDALGRYPDFHESRFRQFTDDELRQFEARTVEACCPDEAATGSSADAWAYETRRHYTQPSWWTSSSRPAADRAAAHDTPGGAAAGVVPPPTTERYDRERVTARESGERRDPDDVSPHYGGRAQPGDVIGIETGGERTHVGETPEDEDERRRDAERALRDGKE